MCLESFVLVPMLRGSRNSRWRSGVLLMETIVNLLRQLRVLKWGQCWNLIKESFSEWANDKVPRLGAALAFYTALSLAPLLVVVLATAGLFYGQAAVQGEIVWQIQDLVGREGAKVVQALLSSAAHRP